MQEVVKIMRRPGCLTSNAHPRLGPSGALSYAVGLVPETLQLGEKDRGFHFGGFPGFHSGAGFHRSGWGFHPTIGCHPHLRRTRPLCFVNVTLKAIKPGAH